MSLGYFIKAWTSDTECGKDPVDLSPGGGHFSTPHSRRDSLAEIPKAGLGRAAPTKESGSGTFGNTPSLPAAPAVAQRQRAEVPLCPHIWTPLLSEEESPPCPRGSGSCWVLSRLRFPGAGSGARYAERSCHLAGPSIPAELLPLPAPGSIPRGNFRQEKLPLNPWDEHGASHRGHRLHLQTVQRFNAQF